MIDSSRLVDKIVRPKIFLSGFSKCSQFFSSWRWIRGPFFPRFSYIFNTFFIAKKSHTTILACWAWDMTWSILSSITYVIKTNIAQFFFNNVLPLVLSSLMPRRNFFLKRGKEIFLWNWSFWHDKMLFSFLLFVLASLSFLPQRRS